MDPETGQVIQLELTPIGVKILRDIPSGLEGIEVYEGVSFCDAARLAASGDQFMLKPGSITVCQWAPVVLGFKAPKNYFEVTIEGRINEPVSGLYLAPVFRFHKLLRPDVVLIRSVPENLDRIIKLLGWENFTVDYMNRIDKSALAVFSDKISGFNRQAVKKTNELLADFNRYELFRKFTQGIFRSTVVTYLFDNMIKRFMADMSMCRNSTVTPFLTGKGNVSYFCTGGIAWGRNDPKMMTMGLPLRLFRRLWTRIDYPGKFRGDPRLRGLKPAQRGINAGITSCSSS